MSLGGKSASREQRCRPWKKLRGCSWCALDQESKDVSLAFGKMGTVHYFPWDDEDGQDQARAHGESGGGYVNPAD